MATEFMSDASELLIQAMRQAGICPKISGEVARQWHADVVKNWSGDRPYIAATAPQAERERSRRDAAILRDWRSGERVPTLMRKYNIGRRRIYQIVDSAEPVQPVCNALP